MSNFVQIHSKLWRYIRNKETDRQTDGHAFSVLYTYIRC